MVLAVQDGQAAFGGDNTMERCERCGADLKVPLVLRVPGHRERTGVFERSGKTLCPEHFDDELANLER
jgi:hypothetical protein